MHRTTSSTANSTMAATKRNGEQQRKVNIQVRGTAGVLVLGGILLGAVAAAVWTPRRARRRRKEDVDTKEDLKLIDVKENDCDLVAPSPSSSNGHGEDIRSGEFIPEDADVIQGNVSRDEVKQDNKTCNGDGQAIIEAKAEIRVHDLVLTAGDQYRNIEEVKDNSEETNNESHPRPSESEAEVMYNGGQVEYATSSLQYEEEVAETEEQALPIQYDEDNALGIEQKTSVSKEGEETDVASAEEASKGDAKSETSWDSSVASNDAAVWPTEMMEEHDIPPLEPIDMEITYSESRKLMENSLELYCKEEEDKHQIKQKKAVESLKATRLILDTKRDYKGLFLVLVVVLAVGMFSFCHHHQLGYVYIKFGLFQAQNDAL